MVYFQWIALLRTVLIEKGFVKLKTSLSLKKTNYIYELTPRGIRAKAVSTVKFLERKRDEYNDLRQKYSD